MVSDVIWVAFPIPDGNTESCERCLSSSLPDAMWPCSLSIFPIASPSLIFVALPRPCSIDKKWWPIVSVASVSMLNGKAHLEFPVSYPVIKPFVLAMVAGNSMARYAVGIMIALTWSFCCSCPRLLHYCARGHLTAAKGTAVQLCLPSSLLSCYLARTIHGRWCAYFRKRSVFGLRDGAGWLLSSVEVITVGRYKPACAVVKWLLNVDLQSFLYTKHSFIQYNQSSLVV